MQLHKRTAEGTQDAYRVAVWGPGSVGTAAIRELILLPETCLVAVFAYSKAKIGVDAGVLVGMQPIGVLTTGDTAVFLSAKPECVVYAARDFGDTRGEDDIAMLLEAGVNVISV